MSAPAGLVVGVGIAQLCWGKASLGGGLADCVVI